MYKGTRRMLATRLKQRTIFDKDRLRLAVCAQHACNIPAKERPNRLSPSHCRLPRVHNCPLPKETRKSVCNQCRMPNFACIIPMAHLCKWGHRSRHSKAHPSQSACQTLPVSKNISTGQSNVESPCCTCPPSDTVVKLCNPVQRHANMSQRKPQQFVLPLNGTWTRVKVAGRRSHETRHACLLWSLLQRIFKSVHRNTKGTKFSTSTRHAPGRSSYPIAYGVHIYV